LETAVKSLYEGMFLVDTAVATADWEGICGVVENILKRAEAEIVSLRKWDERRLAYEIKGVSRGTYILSYFRLAGSRVRDIEREVQLSPKILRVLVLNAEKLTQENVEKDTPAMKLEKERQRVVEEAAARAKEEHAEVSESSSGGDLAASESDGSEQGGSAGEALAQSPEEGISEAGVGQDSEGVEGSVADADSAKQLGDEASEQRRGVELSGDKEDGQEPDSETSI